MLVYRLILTLVAPVLLLVQGWRRGDWGRSLSESLGFGPTGLPMGMQLAGPVGADATVLALGQAWHLATDWPGRRPPDLAQTNVPA